MSIERMHLIKRRIFSTSFSRDLSSEAKIVYYYISLFANLASVFLSYCDVVVL